MSATNNPHSWYERYISTYSINVCFHFRERLGIEAILWTKQLSNPISEIESLPDPLGVRPYVRHLLRVIAEPATLTSAATRVKSSALTRLPNCIRPFFFPAHSIV